MVETYVRPSPFIEERSEQLLKTVFGDPDAERRKDDQGNFIESEEDFNLRKFGRAGVARQIPAFQIADLTGDQRAAFARARQGIDSFAPFITQAGGTLGQGIGAALSGAPLFTQAASIAGRGSALADTGASRITQSDIDAFFNPYQQAVTDEIKRQGDLMKTTAATQAQKAGAFGGSRLGVVEAGIDEGTLRQIGQFQRQGFTDAFNRAEQERRRQLAGGQLLGQLGTGIGALGSRFGALGQQLGTLGAGQAGLGLDLQQAQLRDTASLLGIGGLQQQLQQAGLDAARRTAEAQEMEPFTRLGFASDILTGQPSSYSSITFQDPGAGVNPLSQIAGLGISALGLSRLFSN